MLKPALFVLVVALAGATSARAQTSAQRTACTPDVMRLCAAQIPNAGAITACLRAKRADLSGACRLVMEQADGSVRSVANRR